MTTRIAQHDGHSAVRAAATIWADATARRDGLPAPASVAEKLSGLRSTLSHDGATLHLAMRLHEPVAFVVLVPMSTTLEIRYLAVSPAAWGAGIGTLMLDYVARYARTWGFVAADLWVLEDNERAFAVYLHAGWTPTADVKSQIASRRTERRLELDVGRTS